MRLSVSPATSPGSASVSWIDRMICHRLAPAAVPTSSSSGGTSRIAFSVNRAKNGIPARDMGMMAAWIPIVVPTTSWVNGMTVAISTRNGSDRPRLASQLTTAFTRLAALPQPVS